MNAENRSEVARLLKQITAEYEAAQRGLSGLASGTARHEIINARMDRMGQCFEELAEATGSKEAAIAMMADVLARLPEGGSNHAPQL